MATHKRKKRICKRTQKQLRANQKAKAESQQSPKVLLREVQKDSLSNKILEPSLLKLLQLETNLEWIDDLTQSQFTQITEDVQTGEVAQDAIGEDDLLWADFFIKIVDTDKYAYNENEITQHLNLKWNMTFEETFKQYFARIVDEDLKRIILARVLEIGSGMFKEGRCILIKPGANYTSISKSSINIANMNILFSIELDTPIPRYGDNNEYLGQTFNQIITFLTIYTKEKEMKSKLHEWILNSNNSPQIMKKTLDFQRAHDEYSSYCGVENNLYIPLINNYFESIKEKEENESCVNSNSLAFSSSIKTDDTFIEKENDWFLAQMEEFNYFQVNLSSAEKDVIRKPGSAFVIGRSGTGKTLCAILKLFSEELLYVKALKEESKTGIIKNPQFSNLSKTDSKLKVHTIFLTASSCLSNELYHSYRQMKDEFKIHGSKAKQKESKFKNHERNAQNSINSIASGINKNEEPKELSDDLTFIQSKEYPLFLTIKKFLILIDSTLISPFFVREEGQILYENSLDMYDLLGQEKDMYILDRHSKYAYAAKEVNYLLFYDQFWRAEGGKRKIDSGVVWKEILSYIKGSPIAHLRPNLYLGREEYITHSELRMSNLSAQERNMIYEYFIKYELWKNSSNMYDIMDVANHILLQIENFKYSGPPIHFLICDEVQDLLPAVLYLAMIITERNIFCAGDTAQTIAEGVNFRFQDLKTMFYELLPDKELPPLLSLTENFRSHQQIIDLGNSVLELLERYFPLSIDILKKEKSPWMGHKPIVTGSSPDAIAKVLMKMNFKTELKNENLIFGANQVVLVKDQQTKNTLPSILKTACCLTVLEAKGLEFDHVILYNMFSSSSFRDEYELLKLLEGNVSKGILLKMGDFRERKQDVQGYFHFCSELKRLYTAITRSKRLVIICDDFIEHTRLLLNYWNKYELITDTISSNFDERIDYSLGQYIQMGDKLMDKKNYAEAKQRYIMGNDLNKQTLAEGYYDMEMGVQYRTNGEMENSKNSLSAAATAFAKVNELIMAGRCYVIAQEYKKAIDIFEKLNDYENLGECYSHLPTYVAFIKAVKYYLMSQAYRKALKLCEIKKEYIIMMKMATIIGKQGNNIIAKEGKENTFKYYKSQLTEAMDSLHLHGIPIKLGYQELPNINDELNKLRLIHIDINPQIEKIAAYFELAVSIGYSNRGLENIDINATKRNIIREFKCYSFGYLLDTDPNFMKDCFLGNSLKIAQPLFWLNTRRWFLLNINETIENKLGKKILKDADKINTEFTKWNLNFLSRAKIPVERHIHILNYSNYGKDYNFLDDKAILQLFLTGYWRHILHLGDLIHILDISLSFQQFDYAFELINAYEAKYFQSIEAVQKLAEEDHKVIRNKKAILDTYYAMTLYSSLLDNNYFNPNNWIKDKWYVEEIIKTRKQYQDSAAFSIYIKTRMDNGKQIFSKLEGSNYKYNMTEKEIVVLGIYLMINYRIIHIKQLIGKAHNVAYALYGEYLPEIVNVFKFITSFTEQAILGNEVLSTTKLITKDSKASLLPLNSLSWIFIIYKLWDITPLFGIFNIFNWEYLILGKKSMLFEHFIQHEIKNHDLDNAVRFLESRTNLRQFRNIRPASEKKHRLEAIYKDYCQGNYETNEQKILIIDPQAEYILAPTPKIHELVNESMLPYFQPLIEDAILYYKEKLLKFSAIFERDIFQNYLTQAEAQRQFKKCCKNYEKIGLLFKLAENRTSIINFCKRIDQPFLRMKLNKEKIHSYVLKDIQTGCLYKLFELSMLHWNITIQFEDNKFRTLLLNEAWEIFRNPLDISLRLGSLCFIMLIERKFPYYQNDKLHYLEKLLCDAIEKFQQAKIESSIDNLQKLLVEFIPKNYTESLIGKMLMEKLCALSILLTSKTFPKKEIQGLGRHYPNCYKLPLRLPEIKMKILIATSNIILNILINSIPDNFRNLAQDLLFQLLCALFKRIQNLERAFTEKDKNVGIYLRNMENLNSTIYIKFSPDPNKYHYNPLLYMSRKKANLTKFHNPIPKPKYKILKRGTNELSERRQPNETERHEIRELMMPPNIQNEDKGAIIKSNEATNVDLNTDIKKNNLYSEMDKDESNSKFSEDKSDINKIEKKEENQGKEINLQETFPITEILTEESCVPKDFPSEINESTEVKTESNIEIIDEDNTDISNAQEDEERLKNSIIITKTSQNDGLNENSTDKTFELQNTNLICTEMDEIENNENEKENDSIINTDSQNNENVNAPQERKVMKNEQNSEQFCMFSRSHTLNQLNNENIKLPEIGGQKDEKIDNLQENSKFEVNDKSEVLSSEKEIKEKTEAVWSDNLDIRPSNTIAKPPKIQAKNMSVSHPIFNIDKYSDHQPLLGRVFNDIKMYNTTMELLPTTIEVIEIKQPRKLNLSFEILQYKKKGLSTKLYDSEFYANCYNSIKNLISKRQEIIFTIYKVGNGEVQNFEELINMLAKISNYLDFATISTTNFDRIQHKKIKDETDAFISKLNEFKKNITINLDKDEENELNKRIDREA